MIRFCAARNCPMVGTMRSGFNRGKPWVCSRHFGAHYTDWPKITAEIRKEKQCQTNPPTRQPAT